MSLKFGIYNGFHSFKSFRSIKNQLRNPSSSLCGLHSFGINETRRSYNVHLNSSLRYIKSFKPENKFYISIRNIHSTESFSAPKIKTPDEHEKENRRAYEALLRQAKEKDRLRMEEIQRKGEKIPEPTWKDYANIMLNYPLMLFSILLLTFACYFVVAIDNLRKEYQKYKYNIVLVLGKTEVSPLAYSNSNNVDDYLTTLELEQERANIKKSYKSKEDSITKVEPVILIQDGTAGFIKRQFPDGPDFVTYLRDEFESFIRFMTRCELVLGYYEVQDFDIERMNALKNSSDYNGTFNSIIDEMNKYFNIVAIVIPEEPKPLEKLKHQNDSTGWSLWSSNNQNVDNRSSRTKNHIDAEFIESIRINKGALTEEDKRINSLPIDKISYETLKKQIAKVYWDKIIYLDSSSLVDSKFVSSKDINIQINEYELNRHLVRLMSFKNGSAVNKGTQRAIEKEYVKLNKLQVDKVSRGLDFDLVNNKVIKTSIKESSSELDSSLQQKWEGLV